MAYRDGYAFHEVPIKKAKEAQEERVVVDPWTPVLAKALMNTNETSVGACLEILGVPIPDRPRAIEQRVVGCLRALGWALGQRRRHEGTQIRFWSRRG